jgi:tRNA(Ile2)-agmatinylcytidine synthase
MLRTMHIGIDDTDSTRNGCTTYIAALLVEKLEELRVRFIDYPNLVRLNPNVPWKTRGNGALCLRFEFEEELESSVKEAAIGLVEENSDLNFKGTDPGIVFFRRRQIPEELKAFAKKAETRIVTLKETTSLISRFEANWVQHLQGIRPSGYQRNLWRAITHTSTAYRPRRTEVQRQVDEDSVFEMDRLTQPYTFNNVDLKA